MRPFLMKKIPDFHQTLSGYGLEKIQPQFLRSSFLFLECFKKIIRRFQKNLHEN